MSQVVARPSNLSHTSSYNNNDDSIKDFSLFSSFNSSISTKFSLYRNNSNPQAFGNGYLSEFEDSTQKLPKMGVMSRNQKLRKTQAQSGTTDRLSVTLHTSDSEFTKTRRRRPEFNRQKSISRWMADTFSSTSNILRAVSSHDRLISLSRRSLHNDLDKDRPHLKKNASFRFFQRTDFHKAESTRSILKPVRRPSGGGSEGIVKDVLAALKVTDSTHSTARVGASGFLDGDDIEDDSETDNEEDEFGGSTDFELNSVEFTPTDFATAPPLLSDSKRWDCSSPTRKEETSKDSPNTRRGSVFKSDSRRSSRTMPVPPPPPFTPIKKPSGKLSGKEVLNTALAPLAAAAIAIATDGMGEEIEEEEGVLNDVDESIPKHGKVNNRSDHTDDATASSEDYTCNDSISTDGVSLLSASTFNTNTIPNWTNRSNSSLGLGYALARLNEEDGRKNKNSKPPYSNKDFSNKSGTDDTCESAYTFHHDANDSSVEDRPRFPETKAASEHTRGLEPLLEPPLTPLRDASIVPPAMPRRSLSNRNDSDHDVRMASPADRLKYLLHHCENRRGRRSSMPSGASRWDNGSDHSNSMTMRRASLDNSTHHSKRSRLARRGSLDSCTNYSRLASMRRASLDNSHSSRSRSRRNSIPYPPSLDDSEHLSPESRRPKVNNNGLLTPTVSRTVRASPGMGAHRKRMNHEGTSTPSCGRERTVPSLPGP